jgi:hypothetical protein
MEIDEHLKYTLSVLLLSIKCRPLANYFPAYNSTLAPERENQWYPDAHPTISCDRIPHFCPSEGNWTGGAWGLHTNRALAYLILYGLMPGRLLIPMKIKHLRDPVL